MLAGGAAGAFGAWISGGNILQGALTGAIVAGLNDGLHEFMDPKYEFNVLENKEGAKGAGHQAFAAQKNGKLVYMSKDGTKENFGFKGKPLKSFLKFDNIDQINNYYEKISGGERYDVVATYKMSLNQINKAISTAYEYLVQDYHLFSNNCTTMVQKALYSAYKPISFEFGSHPNKNFDIQQSLYNNHLKSVKYIK